MEKNIPFKVDRETFLSSFVALDTSTEQSIEKDFILPDYCPDIFRILKCKVLPNIVSHNINGDKLNLELNVLIKVIYLSEDCKKINVLEQKLSYSKSINIDNECINPVVNTSSHVDYINCRVVNQRRVDVRGAVSSCIKVISEKKQQLIVNATGGNIQLKKSTITFPSKRLISSKRITIIEELELGLSKPHIDTVLRSDFIIQQHEQKIIAGKLVIKGEAEISILYASNSDNDSSLVEPMKFSVPFSQILDIDGIDETYNAFVEIIPVNCEIIPKNDNSNEIECELVMLVNCKAMKFETCDVVTDAFSTCYECATEAIKCSVENIPVVISDTFDSSSQFSCSDGTVLSIADAWCDISNISVRYSDETKNPIVSGNCVFCVIGKNSSDEIIYFENDAPFDYKLNIDYDENTKIDINAFPKNCSYHIIDDKTVEVKTEILINGSVYAKSASDSLKSLNILNDKPKEKYKKYAVKICYFDKNEDLWEIAKKYSASVDAVIEENDLDPKNKNECGMILIPLTD